MTRQPTLPREPRFDGDTYEPAQDSVRLTGMLLRVYEQMSRSLASTPTATQWWTLRALADCCQGSEASISARIRDLRKPKFGGYTVERKRIRGGLYAYRLVVEE